MLVLLVQRLVLKSQSVVRINPIEVIDLVIVMLEMVALTVNNFGRASGLPERIISRSGNLDAIYTAVIRANGIGGAFGLPMVISILLPLLLVSAFGGGSAAMSFGSNRACWFFNPLVPKHHKYASDLSYDGLQFRIGTGFLTPHCCIVNKIFWNSRTREFLKQLLFKEL